MSVADMAAAREERVERQRRMLEKWHVPLVSMTLNIAGSVKYDRVISAGFDEACERVRHALAENGFEILEEDERREFTGCELMLAVNADAERLKGKMVAVEDRDAFGRLIDADVIAADGEKLSRGRERTCLICGKPVYACARSRAHSAEALFDAAQEIILQFLRCKLIARMAMEALIDEARATPKPGLVDLIGNGAHRDMNALLLFESADALLESFVDFTAAGLNGADFDTLRKVGIEAEERMFAATKGVNTHKGAIFLFSFLLAAAGEHADDVFARAGELAKPCMKDFEAGGTTGGLLQYAEYGLTGARGEAAGGYPSVRMWGLPMYEKCLAKGMSQNDAACHALLKLMSEVTDSNIVRRGGLKKAKAVQRRAAHILTDGVTADALLAFDAWMVKQNLSPGGCADLLAVTIFMEKLKVSGLNDAAE